MRSRMDSLCIRLLHCHGIRRLAMTTFDFKEKGHVAIYNSFMYEPILDMPADSLAGLYDNVRTLDGETGGA